MQQILSVVELPSVLLSGALGVLVAIALVFGLRAHSATAGCRLFVAVGVACLVWAAVAIVSAPLR